MRTKLAATLLPAIALSGCLQSATLVKVNADGSGTLENETLMTSAALAQLRQLTTAFAGANAKPLDPFSEDQARTVAGQMGEGVTLVSSMPIKTAMGEGRASAYGFRDITKLRVSQVPVRPGDAAIGLGAVSNQDAQVTIDLARTATGNVLLTVHTPGDPVAMLSSQMGSMNRRRGPVAPDQMAMMREMLAGMQIALRVEPSGRLVRTNSPYVDGQIVTLFDVNVDALIKDEQAFSRLQSAKTPAEMADALKNVPGVKIAGQRDITIEFTP